MEEIKKYYNTKVFCMWCIWCSVKIYPDLMHWCQIDDVTIVIWNMYKYKVGAAPTLFFIHLLRHADAVVLTLARPVWMYRYYAKTWVESRL